MNNIVINEDFVNLWRCADYRLRTATKDERPTQIVCGTRFFQATRFFQIGLILIDNNKLPLSKSNISWITFWNNSNVMRMHVVVRSERIN